MSKPGVTAHLLLKNEDRWVWFALQSILPFVDQVLITDTGSTDQTLKVIKSIASPKIKLTKVRAMTQDAITSQRQAQLQVTKTPWIWILDGDEIYPKTLAQECLGAVNSAKYEGIVVRRRDLLGDIYHAQRESVGSYRLFGHQGHLLVRLVNRDKITGLHYRGAYPLEGFFDGKGISILDRHKAAWYITTNSLYHAMYLRRSSLGSNLPMFNRSKYKIETGIKLSSAYPEVFDFKRPAFVPDPLARRSLAYELAAAVITPVKTLKRKLI